MKIIYQEKPLYPKILWQRPVHTYKAEAGKILIIAGSKGSTGTAILTCEAVFRSGTGILLLGFPESLKSFYKDVLPEAMTLELPETPGHTLSRKAKNLILENVRSCDVTIIGPGLSTNAETIGLIWEVIFDITKPVVVDADGLIALIKGIEVMRARECEEFVTEYFKKRPNLMVITADAGELSKLARALKLDKKYTNRYIELHKEEFAPMIAQKLSCYAVIKGLQTVMAAPEGQIIVNRIDTPNINMASADDVLSGVVVSFMGQNPDKPLEAISTAIFLHGLAGKLASEQNNDRALLGSDIIRYLPKAIKIAEDL